MVRKSLFLFGLAFAACGLMNPAATAGPTTLLHEIFQDHAVLQRDRPIPLWGDVRPRESVSVDLDGHTIGTRADAAGHWRADLPSLRAGGPYSLTVTAGSGARQTLVDILIGDVFLCSGQSNMELPVARSSNAEREISLSASDRIRVLSVGHATSPTPAAHFQDPVAWMAAAPATIRDFSAVCYYFARELQKTEDVPLGLIHASWGGSRIEPWMSAGGLESVGGFDAALNLLRTDAKDPAAGIRLFGGLWESWWTAHAPTHSTPWEGTPTGEWRPVPVPLRDWKTWGVPELANHDGMVWFRRSVTLTQAQADAAGSLSIGAIDEVDETWVNGVPIGNSFGYGTERTYIVPPGLLHAGDNIVVINVLSTWDAGGMYGPPEHLALRLSNAGTMPLGGGWRYQFVPESMGLPPRAPWEAVSGLTSIYNAMISPLEPYALRGVLWYQGESNTGEPDRYRGLLTALMRDWRQRFGPDLAFLIVQLPNFGVPSSRPESSNWAALREAQRLAVAGDPNAALAVTIDVGDAHDLHPPNKQTVGSRLAHAARHLLYGDPAPASGPVPRAARRGQDRVVVDFDGVEGALVSLGSARPTGFELCGADEPSCRFVDASVQTDRVILTPGIGPATRVRFCWSDAPICNLYDESALPAGPFEIPIH